MVVMPVLSPFKQGMQPFLRRYFLERACLVFWSFSLLRGIFAGNFCESTCVWVRFVMLVFQVHSCRVCQVRFIFSKCFVSRILPPHFLSSPSFLGADPCGWGAALLSSSSYVASGGHRPRPAHALCICLFLSFSVFLSLFSAWVGPPFLSCPSPSRLHPLPQPRSDCCKGVGLGYVFGWKFRRVVPDFCRKPPPTGFCKGLFLSSSRKSFEAGFVAGLCLDKLYLASCGPSPLSSLCELGPGLQLEPCKAPIAVSNLI